MRAADAPQFKTRTRLGRACRDRARSRASVDAPRTPVPSENRQAFITALNRMHAAPVAAGCRRTNRLRSGACRFPVLVPPARPCGAFHLTILGCVGAMKGPDGRGLQTKEETMSTFTTIAALARLTDRELRDHFSCLRGRAKEDQHSEPRVDRQYDPDRSGGRKRQQSVCRRRECGA